MKAAVYFENATHPVGSECLSLAAGDHRNVGLTKSTLAPARVAGGDQAVTDIADRQVLATETKHNVSAGTHHLAY